LAILSSILDEFGKFRGWNEIMTKTVRSMIRRSVAEALHLAGNALYRNPFTTGAAQGLAPAAPQVDARHEIFGIQPQRLFEMIRRASYISGALQFDPQ